MKSLAQFKRGDSFSLLCTFKTNDVPADIAGLNITCQIRNIYGMALVDQLVVTPQSSNLGQFTLTPSNPDTSAWPLGNLLCDLEIAENDIIRSSSTFLVPVIEGVSND